MTLRRGIAWFFAIFGVLLIGCASYLAFVDLGIHKTRIESLVSDITGRTFSIDGELKIELFPSVQVVAENVHLANAEWASKEPMLQVGRFAAHVGLWSLMSGPVDVRSFELSDVAVVLEKGRDGKANWIFSEPDLEEVVVMEPAGSPLPMVIEKANLKDVRVIFRERGKQDRVAKLDRLTIAPGKAGLIALEGRGKLNEFPITLDGEAGPLDSLLKGRDIRMDMKASVGRLALDIHGGFGRLDPLDGADLKIKAEGKDVDALLTRLELPVFVTGDLKIDAMLEDAGKLTKFALDATAGDLRVKAGGTLSGLQLLGADVKFEFTAADAARLASVFGIKDVPAAPLTFSGGVKPLRKEIRFEALQAQLAGALARIDGKLLRGRDAKTELKFELGVEDLSALRADLPKSKLSASGNFAADKEKLEVADFTAALGENQLSGHASLVLGELKRIEADFTAPFLDLTPLFPPPPEAAGKAEPGAAKAEPVKAESTEPKKKFLFGEEPLPLVKLRGNEANLHLAIAELKLSNKSLKDVDLTAVVDKSHVTLTARARGSIEGTMESSITVEPIEGDSAKLNLKFGLENLRAGLDMKDMQATEVPPLGIALELTTQGRSPRELATNSNGHMLLTQGAGKTKAEFLDAFGGNVLAELRSRLNPFRAQDPFTKLDCTVVRADIVDGAVTVKPVLLQTLKVTVVAQGNIDLHTEKFNFDFDTRPRKGIGVSPGMFANPFIKVEGTLMNPRLAVGAKGAASAGVAAATGGLSVIWGGIVDRVKGEADMCKKALETAAQPATQAAEASKN
jgi:uncharacterized protein involved in outer membrane biogenesis